MRCVSLCRSWMAARADATRGLIGVGPPRAKFGKAAPRTQGAGYEAAIPSNCPMIAIFN